MANLNKNKVISSCCSSRLSKDFWTKLWLWNELAPKNVSTVLQLVIHNGSVWEKVFFAFFFLITCRVALGSCCVYQLTWRRLAQLLWSILVISKSSTLGPSPVLRPDLGFVGDRSVPKNVGCGSLWLYMWSAKLQLCLPCLDFHSWLHNHGLSVCWTSQFIVYNPQRKVVLTLQMQVFKFHVKTESGLFCQVYCVEWTLSG